MQNLNQKPSGLSQQMAEFFFARETPWGLALVRILLCTILAAVMLQRWPYVRELFSTDGVIIQLSMGYGYGRLMPEFPAPVAVALFAAMIFFLLTSAAGFYTRFSLGSAFVLFTYFNMLDSVSTMTKYSVIACHALLLMTLSDCGLIWSVDAWLRKRRGETVPCDVRTGLPVSQAWTRRLMQLMVAYVYFGAAITKMHTPSYFSGDQLKYWMLSNWNYSHVMGEWLTLTPALLGIFSYVAIVWELTFIFLVWKRSVPRLVMLGMGILFHVMTTVMLGLYVFPLVSLSIYFCYLDEQDVQWWGGVLRSFQATRLGGWLNRLKPSWSVPSFRLPGWNVAPQWLLGGALLATMLCALEIEHLMDPFGMRRTEGKYALKELDPVIVNAMLNQRQPLRLEDRFFSFDVGTFMVNGNLVNRRRTFQIGETAVVECCLNPPHEDMWVECNLHDSQDRVISRVQTMMPREKLRCAFKYEFTEQLAPGDYHLVLKSAGKEVERRTIHLFSNQAAPVAN